MKDNSASVLDIRYTYKGLLGYINGICLEVPLKGQGTVASHFGFSGLGSNLTQGRNTLELD